MSRRLSALLPVFIVLFRGCHVFGGATSLASLSQWNVSHVPRQVAPSVPTTTSSFNWWPYPPWGVSTSTSTPFVPTSTTLLTSSSTGDGSSSVTTVTYSDDNNTTTSISSTTSSLSMMHISAQPPANTTSSSTTLPKLKHSPSFHVIYLVPVFALLGVILGSVTAWLCYGLIKTRRGPRRRADSLEPGPAYQATPKDEDWIYDEKDEMGTLRSDDGSPSKYCRHGSSYSRQSGGWLGRGLSTRLQREKTFDWPDIKQSAGYGEAQTFLGVPSATRGLSTRTKASTIGSVYTSLTDEEDVDTSQYRNKSVRRSIFGRLNTKKSQRSGRTQLSFDERDEEKVELDRTRSDMTKTSRTSSFRRSSRSHRRAHSDLQVKSLSRPARMHSSEVSPRKERDVLRRTGSGTDETEWVQGSGFRIVEEHLERISAQVRDGVWEDENSEPKFKQPETPKKERSEPVLQHEEDKYTPIPMRRTPTKGRSSGAFPISPPRRMNRADSVLPMSPPQIMTPPLEDILFFQSPSRTMLVNEMKKIPSRKTTLARSVKVPSQCHSPATPSGLPSNRNLPHRNDSKKTREIPVTPTRSGSVASKGTPHSASPSKRPLPARRNTAAERFYARRDALNKVESIVSRSWSQRSFGEIERIGSPTMFGAQVDSLQQRLATLEEQ